MERNEKPYIAVARASRLLLAVNGIFALIYLSWWFDIKHIGNPLLYVLLFFGEIYHVFMVFAFLQTVWPVTASHVQNKNANDHTLRPSVDIFITVAGEPVEVVQKTALAAKHLTYQRHNVYILNDGYVAKKDNWRDIELMAWEIGVQCITRKIPGGAKAGNINNALQKTSGDIVVIFDADMEVYPEFLEKVIPYFSDPNVGFIQAPQYYKNNNSNEITRGAWEQQEFFFGPIMVGKGEYNSAILCGTNVAIRRVALKEVGGMCEDNIAEDFLTSLFIHQNGWRSYYLQEVLAEGLAPQDLLSYYKQQHRWARGSLEVLFTHNPIFKRGLTWKQKLQYISSSAFYFNGVIILIDLTMPLIFLYSGISPVASATTSFAFFFLPFIFFVFYALHTVSQGRLTFRAISFTHASFVLQLLALWALVVGQKTNFSVTPKEGREGNFLFLAYPHILYIMLAAAGSTVAVLREGINPSVASNIAWALFNIIMFLPYIAASYRWETLFNIPWLFQKYEARN